MNLFFNEQRASNSGTLNDSSEEKPRQILAQKKARSMLQTTETEPNIDKWPFLAVQINFQKSEKKTCHPLKC